MDWTIDEGRMPSYIHVETSGEATAQDLAAMWDEILSSKSWRPGQTVLLDNRKLAPIKDPDPFTMAGIDYFTRNAARVGKACISTISSEHDSFKYVRQFQHGIRLKGSDVVLQLFNSETQAVNWLNHYSSVYRNLNSRTAA